MGTTPTLDADPIHRAADALAEGRVHVGSDPTPGRYRVASFTDGGVEYIVDVQSKTCSCPSARFQGAKPCKHVAAIVLLQGVG